MQITLSFATTADGYLDDNSPRRLMISTPEDWEAALRLRASHDAILAGAETLRRDDPALLLRDAAARELRSTLYCVRAVSWPIFLATNSSPSIA